MKNHKRCVHALFGALLITLPGLSQGQVDGSPVHLDGDRSADINEDSQTITSEYPDGGRLDGEAGNVVAADYNAGVLNFTICDSRTGETGSQIRISPAGSVITRNVQCD